jgi:hypothetical protein
MLGKTPQDSYFIYAQHILLGEKFPVMKGTAGQGTTDFLLQA